MGRSTITFIGGLVWKYSIFRARDLNDVIPAHVESALYIPVKERRIALSIQILRIRTLWTLASLERCLFLLLPSLPHQMI